LVMMCLDCLGCWWSWMMVCLFFGRRWFGLCVMLIWFWLVLFYLFYLLFYLLVVYFMMVVRLYLLFFVIVFCFCDCFLFL